MKKLFMLLLITVGIINANAQTKPLIFTYFKGNGEDGLHLAYSRDGYTFESLNNDKSLLQPVVGVSKLMRDPCVIQTPDGVFHMVWTAGWTEKGIGYASSRDLINWSEQKYLEVMKEEPTARNCWAPEIVYDKKQKQFLIFWATTIPGRFPDTEKAGDGGYNHRMYCTTTKDFVNLTETKLFYDKGFNVIDATINKTGRLYTMFLKDETRNPAQKNIRIATSKSVYGPWSAASEPITGKYWAEGPTAVRIDGRWIVYFDKYTEHKYGAVASTDLKKWDDISDKISFPEGARHGTIIKVTDEVLQDLLNMKSP